MPRWTKTDRSPLGNIRAEAGFSRESAASTLNISLSTMIRYETGSTDIPIGIAEAMAVIYKVPFDLLREAIKETKTIKGIQIMGKPLKNNQKITTALNVI
mgnify:CR=1 FL=1